MPIFTRFYPHVTQKVLWQDFDVNFQCFTSIQELFGKLKTSIPNGLDGLQDWSIMKRFPALQRATLTGSTFLANELADVTRFNLERPYVVIQADTPYNDPDHREFRSFNRRDHRGVVAYLEQHNLIGVYLDAKEASHPPAHDLVVDLVGQTTVEESLEILKNGVGYLGIDSWLSVMAAELPFEHFKIKLNNYHGIHFKSVYWAPYKTFDFLLKHLGDQLPVKTIAEVLDKDIMSNKTIKVRLLSDRLINGALCTKGSEIVITEEVCRKMLKYNLVEKLDVKPVIKSEPKPKVIEKATIDKSAERKAVTI